MILPARVQQHPMNFLSMLPSTFRSMGGRIFEYDGRLSFVSPSFGFRPVRQLSTCDKHHLPIARRTVMCAQERDGASTLADLELQLAYAVKEERYRDAARIRDQIKSLGGVRAPAAAGSENADSAGGRKETPDEIRERLRQREISRFRDIDTGGDNMATPF
jgi:hypothetical protein